MGDVVYTDADYAEVAVLHDADMCVSFGDDENSVTVTLPTDGPKLEFGCLVYERGTEAGGVIDDRAVKTKDGKAVYSGRSWHGILEGRVITPPSGQDHYTASGDANAVLAGIVAYLDLGDVFEAHSAPSGIAVEYRFPRYEDEGAYTSVRKMLASCGAKLKMDKRDRVVLSAHKAAPYRGSVDDEKIDFQIVQKTRPPNHLICVGAGEGQARTRVDWYADGQGVVSDVQTFFGKDMVEDVYDYANADEDELRERGKKKLEELQSGAALEVFSQDLDFDVGDTVAGYEKYTGLDVSATVTQKIVRYKAGERTTEYQSGGAFASLHDAAESTPGTLTYITDIEPDPAALKVGDVVINPSTRRTKVVING